MRKVSEPEQKIIASLVASGQSIEFIKEKYKVAERQINSYVKKYSDDESFLVSHKLIDTPTEEKINNNLLTEEYIMENHLKLREYIDDKYETKKEFIKRQTRIPCIYINPKDYEDFSASLVDLEEVKWNQSEVFYKRIRVYPEREAFLTGELVYRISQKIYVKEKHLSKKGFMQKIEGTGNVFILTTPLKLYKKESYRVIKRWRYTLNKVLRENKLHQEKKRSKAFNDFLIEHHYIDKSN